VPAHAAHRYVVETVTRWAAVAGRTPVRGDYPATWAVVAATTLQLGFRKRHALAVALAVPLTMGASCDPGANPEDQHEQQDDQEDDGGEEQEEDGDDE